MQALVSTLPTLSMLPSTASPCRAERDINRSALLDIAPDREMLLTSTKSIEEIRHSLKIRTGSVNGQVDLHISRQHANLISILHRHWLYRTQNHLDVKVSNATTRTSTFIKNNETPDENAGVPIRNVHIVRRRVLSASSIYTPTMSSITNRLMAPGNDVLDIWGTPDLSTPDKLISPRPLGATHLLVVYASQPSTLITKPMDKKATLTRREANTTMVYPQLLEIPINDLLFILNVPNLAASAPDRTPTSSPILPRRLHKELPRVLMHVPHLDTFPELMVYIHTKNQAELFRRLIPEWVRDLMHPLPSVAAMMSANSNIPIMSDGRNALKRGVNHIQLLGRLVSASSSSSSLDSLVSTSSPRSSTSSGSSEPERTIDLIAREVAEASYTPPAAFTAFSSAGADPLVRATASLNALRDNLEYLGYYGKSIWNELDVCREILIRAVSCKARVGKVEAE